MSRHRIRIARETYDRLRQSRGKYHWHVKREGVEADGRERGDFRQRQEGTPQGEGGAGKTPRAHLSVASRENTANSSERDIARTQKLGTTGVKSTATCVICLVSNKMCQRNEEMSDYLHCRVAVCGISRHAAGINARERKMRPQEVSRSGPKEVLDAGFQC